MAESTAVEAYLDTSVLPELTFGEFEMLSEAEQQEHERNRIRAISGRCDDCLIGFDAGTASFSDLLCKLWRWVVGAARAIIDGIKTVLIDLVKAAFEILAPIIDGLLDVGSSLLKSPLVWIAAGVALLWFIGSGDDKETKYISGVS